jgi:anti-anti-sigma factor
MDEVKVETSAIPAGTVAKIIGELKLRCEPCEIGLRRILAGHPKLLILDLSQLSFVSSLGMGLLISTGRSVKLWGGTVCLAAGQPLVLESLQRARLLDVLKHYPTVEDAVQANGSK